MCKNHKHLYTPIIESQIMSELPFTIATKNKIPNTTYRECEESLQGELQTTHLLKEIREDTKKW